MNMTPELRVKNTLKGEKTDRAPICFWHHFKDAKSGEDLAEKTVDFFVKKYGLDIIKIMPDIPYPVERNSLENSSQLADLPNLKNNDFFYKEQLTCIKKIRSLVGPKYPLVITLFSPLSFALRFIGKKRGVEVARDNPGLFSQGLEKIASNLLWFVKEAIAAGANGLFFSVMGGNSGFFTREEYKKFGCNFDKMVLDQAKDGWLNILHIHTEPDQSGDKLYTELFENYPVAVFSWSDRLNGPSITDMLKTTNKCLMGGLSERGPIVNGSEKEITAEIKNAVDQSQSRRLILSSGCSIPDNTTVRNLEIAINVLHNFKNK
jgi:uroporphyrinogen decarboxylase